MVKGVEQTATVLIVEDDDALRYAWGRLLGEEGLSVRLAADGEEGVRLALEQSPDAIVLDVRLPKRDGLDVLRALRTAGSTAHVLVVSAFASTDDCVAAFDAGGDAWLPKPLAARQLGASVMAALRRVREYTTRQAARGSILRSGDLIVDPLTGAGRRGRRALHLSTIEVRLITHFIEHDGEVVPFSTLRQVGWCDRPLASGHPIEAALFRLRRKLNGIDETQILRNIRGIGYRFDAALDGPGGTP
jgi:two-component system, OmpR family, response regulator